MLKTLPECIKIKDVRRKTPLYVLYAGCDPYRIAAADSWVNTTFFQELFTRQSNDAFGFFNTITGGSFTNMSVFA